MGKSTKKPNSKALKTRILKYTIKQKNHKCNEHGLCTCCWNYREQPRIPLSPVQIVPQHLIASAYTLTDQQIADLIPS